ncbi:MAG: AraC family transcriptional regulator [Oscillospiraceae bacterium]
MLDRSEVGKRGYLKEDFRLFHLRDSRAQKLDYHYHEFDKVILLLSGKVTYVVEGKSYFLKPGDILLVQHNMIHMPVIDPSEPYERMVLWLGPEYLERRKNGEESLSDCFALTHRRNFHLLRGSVELRQKYLAIFQGMEEALTEEGFGHELLADTYFLQLMIHLNRDLREDKTAELTETYRYDPKIEEIMRFVEANPAEDLSVEGVAKRFFLSRYYLMHRFKEVSGYTLHQYVNQKRIQYAGELLRQGTGVLKAAEQAGFREYSTFLRAFQNTYHMSPREFLGQG